MGYATGAIRSPGGDDRSRTRALPVRIAYWLIYGGFWVMLGLIWWPMWLYWPAFALVILLFAHVGAVANGDRRWYGRRR